MKKPKETYGVLDGIRFMVSAAWETRKQVVFVTVWLAVLTVARQVCRLFVAPEILSRVEEAAPLSQLLATIAIFTLLELVLSMTHRYGEETRMSGEISVRTAIVLRINRKACTTSYPNVHDPEMQKRKQAASEATEGNHEASEHIWRTLTSVLENALGFGVYLLVLRELDGWMLLTVLLTTGLSYLAARKSNLWNHTHRDELVQVERQINYVYSKSRARDLAKDIRIFGLESWLREIQEKAYRAWENYQRRMETAVLMANLADVALTFLRNGIAYAYLIARSLERGWTASEFLLYFTAVTGLTEWVGGLLRECGTLHRECTDLSGIQVYLNQPEQFRTVGGEAVPKADSYELRLENVTFRYPGADNNLFEHLNLTIRPGEKLAVVGLNGAGKTTLVKLLCGFYDPDGGRVLLNGRDIRDFDRREYYALFSAVFQEFTLLDVTIAEQVAQQVAGIDNAKLWDSLEKAGLSDFVKSLPNGEQTHMGREVYLDGILLSGGQTQRLMLARALYKNGSILVLDEPTAALDPIAENDIYQKYNAMTAGKTAIFISHRLASTRFCDRILFVDQGTVAEEGTHAELLALGGKYAELYHVQSRYYQEGGMKDAKI